MEEGNCPAERSETDNMKKKKKSHLINLNLVINSMVSKSEIHR